MKFANKKAVVTGGGGGQGRAISLAFAREGADIAVLDFVLENAKKVAAEVSKLGRKAIAMKLDVADFKASHDCIEKVLEDFKHIDIIVNAAGYGQYMPFTEMTEEVWDRSIATHLKGTFNITRAAINSMVAQGSGRIINVSSAAGVGGTPKHVQYSAAKAGVLGFTKALAKEVALKGITVNAIAPGLIDTPFIDSLKKSPDVLEYAKNLTPVGRLGKPEEIAGLCLYLASDEAGYITGQTININGGLYMW